jgi:FkbM family methyltransferase
MVATSEPTCGCSLCSSDAAPRVAAIHDVVARVRGVLTDLEIAQCLTQLADGKLHGHSDDLLGELGDVPTRELGRAREAAERERSRLARLGRELPARIRELARDAATAAWLRSVLTGNAPEGPGATRVELALHGREYSLEIPDSRDCIDNVVQVLFLEQYGPERTRPGRAPVSRIYDLGAFIGLSAAYLHSLHPGADVVAVEPCPANLAVLRRNFDANPALRGVVVPSAVAASTGSTVLQAPSSVGWGASSREMGSRARFERLAVDGIDLAELVVPGPHGIKLDIEGAEFDLRERSDVLGGARWIVGELHYGAWTTPEDRWLREMLSQRFELTLSSPIVIDDGPGFWVSQDFAARARR